QAALARERRGLDRGAFLVARAGKTDADLMTAEHGVFAPGRRVLLVEDLAFPAAIGAGVGAEIIEERVAAEDAAVIEQHHAGHSAVDAIKRAKMDGIESVDDSTLAHAAGNWQRLLLDRRHHRFEGRAG